jgi:hypothetical protein
MVSCATQAYQRAALLEESENQLVVSNITICKVYFTLIQETSPSEFLHVIYV